MEVNKAGLQQSFGVDLHSQCWHCCSSQFLAGRVQVQTCLAMVPWTRFQVLCETIPALVGLLVPSFVFWPHAFCLRSSSCYHIIWKSLSLDWWYTAPWKAHLWLKVGYSVSQVNSYFWRLKTAHPTIPPSHHPTIPPTSLDAHPGEWGVGNAQRNWMKLGKFNLYVLLTTWVVSCANYPLTMLGVLTQVVWDTHLIHFLMCELWIVLPTFWINPQCPHCWLNHCRIM